MKIAVIGAGAFGTALAIALSENEDAIILVGRDGSALRQMQDTRVNPRLPGVHLPRTLAVATSLPPACDIILLATPAQTLSQVLGHHGAQLGAAPLVACCKGIDLTTLTGPADVIQATCRDNTPAVLTGPSFAADIAQGLPTALTLACHDPETAIWLQSVLSTPALRLYRTTDVTGAQLGGALKNVMAIACGATIGAGLGDSARAALMTRGFAEMARLAETQGAQPETLNGLSGFGDLALTCTSDLSRNYRYGIALGAGQDWDPTITVEGAATARAASDLAQRHDLDLPVTQTVAALVSGKVTVKTALGSLLSRPLKEE